MFLVSSYRVGSDDRSRASTRTQKLGPTTPREHPTVALSWFDSSGLTSAPRLAPQIPISVCLILFACANSVGVLLDSEQGQLSCKTVEGKQSCKHFTYDDAMSANCSSAYNCASAVENAHVVRQSRIVFHSTDFRLQPPILPRCVFDCPRLHAYRSCLLIQA